MLPPRPNPPAELISTVFVLVGSKFAPGRLPGIKNASSRKFLPFSGIFAIVVEVICPCNIDCVKSMLLFTAFTSTVLACAATLNVVSSVDALPALICTCV